MFLRGCARGNSGERIARNELSRKCLVDGQSVFSDLVIN